MVQLSHLYVTTRKTIALMIWNLDSKVMSLIFNMLSGFVIAFLPRSKCLLIVHYNNFNLIGKVCRSTGDSHMPFLHPPHSNVAADPIMSLTTEDPTQTVHGTKLPCCSNALLSEWLVPQISDLPNLNTFEDYRLVICKVKVVQSCPSLATPWTIQSMEFSRPECWNGWPFPSPGYLPNPGIEPRSLHCRQILCQLSHRGSHICRMSLNLGLSDNFLMLNSSYEFLVRMSWKWCCDPIGSYLVDVICICPISSDVDFDHLNKMVAASFVHCNVIFPLNKWYTLQVRYFEAMKFPVLHQILPPSLYWFVFLARVDYNHDNY